MKLHFIADRVKITVCIFQFQWVIYNSGAEAKYNEDFFI